MSTARKDGSRGFATRAVQTGVARDPHYGSVVTPVYATSSFEFDRPGVARAGYDYTRSGNPTRSALEENLASLEGGHSAWATCTGMAAETTVMMLFAPGDHVVVGRDVYAGTYRLFESVFAERGLRFSYVDTTDPREVRSAIVPETRALWVETYSNPLLNVVDLEALGDIACEAGALLIVDNTFLSPYFVRPLEYGADLVVHSTTKYINGHSDVVGGAIVAANDEMSERIGFLVNALGTACAPLDAWLVLRGVKTLALRMEAHQRNALAAAHALSDHPAVVQVLYPGHPSHPQHALARRLGMGFGGVVTVRLDTRSTTVEGFLAGLGLFTLAESLGGVESLVEHPWTMSHASMDERARRAAGIDEGTVRLSVGIEDAGDLVSDLLAALDGAHRADRRAEGMGTSSSMHACGEDGGERLHARRDSV